MTITFRRTRAEDKIFGKLEGTEKLIKKGIRQGMFRTGHGLITAANQAILHETKTGRIYIRKDRAGRKRRHRSSASGQSHANFTGKLRRSLSFQLRGVSEIEFGYGVSSGKEAPDYARFVEIGTFRMRPRPSIKNALDSEQGNIVGYFDSDISAELK